MLYMLYELQLDIIINLGIYNNLKLFFATVIYKLKLNLSLNVCQCFRIRAYSTLESADYSKHKKTSIVNIRALGIKAWWQ